MTPGAQFGNFAGNQRSNFDNVDISSNGANGIFFSSQFTGSPLQDPASRTYFDLNSVSGTTQVSNNVGHGVLLQYTSGIHDVTIRGDGVAVAPIVGGGNQISTFTTAIQSNGKDGIHLDSGNFANATVNLEKVLIGGSTRGQGNKGDGISINAVEFIQLNSIDNLPNNVGIAGYTEAYEHAGIATLNANNITVMNNLGNGITLYGSNLLKTTDATVNGFDPADVKSRTFNNTGDGWGQISSTLTNTNVLNNGQSATFINILGQMGSYRSPSTGNSVIYNTFNFDNVNISNNGNYGIYFEGNAASTQHSIIAFTSVDPDPVPPNYPLKPKDLGFLDFFNSGENSPIRDAFFMSNFMDISNIQPLD